MAETTKAEAAQTLTSFEKARRWAFGVLALLAVLGAILRILGVKEADREAIYFLIVAGVILTLERVRKFSLSPDGISFEAAEEIKEKLDRNLKVAVEGQRIARSGAGGKIRSTKAASAKTKAAALPPVVDDDDPQKGRFGGKAESNDRKLTAEVTSATGVKGFYNIHLEVQSTDTKKPLDGTVRFYLHDTFSPDVQKCPVVDGVAELDLVGYGAFTVGALADDGATKLELDLSADKSFPKAFRES